jgi:hypothetical protein
MVLAFRRHYQPAYYYHPSLLCVFARWIHFSPCMLLVQLDDSYPVLAILIFGLPESMSFPLYLCTMSSRVEGDFSSADVQKLSEDSGSTFCFAANSSLVLRQNICTRRSRACSLAPEVDSRSRASSM